MFLYICCIVHFIYFCLVYCIANKTNNFNFSFACLYFFNFLANESNTKTNTHAIESNASESKRLKNIKIKAASNQFFLLFILFNCFPNESNAKANTHAKESNASKSKRLQNIKIKACNESKQNGIKSFIFIIHFIHTQIKQKQQTTEQIIKKPNKKK